MALAGKRAIFRLVSLPTSRYDPESILTRPFFVAMKPVAFYRKNALRTSLFSSDALPFPAPIGEISRALALALLPMIAAAPAQAFCEDPATFVGGVCKTFSDTWQQGQSDVLLPFHTHHLRYAYTREKIDSFVEDTWGVGYGRTRYDERGNSDSLYAMGFRDSHGKFEPIVGYAHRWNWGNLDGVNAGLGYTVFLTARSDIAHYFPIPGVLPVASINYRRAGVNMTYLPGGAGNGNILFFWGSVGF